MEKRILRKEVLARRNEMPEQERKEKSIEIASKVCGLDVFQNGNVILLYEAIRSEVETKRIYAEAKRQGKEIYYPRVEGEKMEFYRVDETTRFDISAFGIREPLPESTEAYVPNSDDVLLLLMPGAVFDEEGNRIGYGGGYYDKYIHWLYQFVAKEKVEKVAMCFACQLVDVGVIEREEHDIQVDYIVTEEDVYGKFI